MLKKPKPAKKGLGAQRVQADFSKIEQEAQKADELQDESKVIPFGSTSSAKLTAEERVEQFENIQTMYQDMSAKQEETAQKMRTLDPSKAEQLERLGMGFQNVLTSPTTSSSKKGGKSNNRSGVSHSAVNDMEVIEQVESKPSRKQSLGDEFGITRESPSARDLDRDMMLLDLGLSSASSGHHNLTDDSDDFFSSFGPKKPSRQSSYEIETIESHSKSSKPSIPSPSSDASSANIARDKFGSAKGISSDQFFGPKESEFETRSQLTKFQGSNSISSDQYFGRESSVKQSNSSYYASAVRDANMDDIKDGVREGVTKVAGKLSALANDVMTSINEKYGY